MFASLIEFLFIEFSPFLVVGLSSLYFVAKNWSLSPYILVFGWIFFIFILLSKAILECNKNKWIHKINECLKPYQIKDFIKESFQSSYTHSNWIGYTAGLFAFANTLLGCPYIWYNLNIFKIFYSAIKFLTNCYTYIMNPPLLLLAFDNWKDSIPFFGTALNFGTEYVHIIITKSSEGSIEIPLVISVATGIFTIINILAYNFPSNVYKVFLKMQNLINQNSEPEPDSVSINDNNLQKNSRN